MTMTTSNDIWQMAQPADKAFIHVGGDEAAIFLQSLLTANIDLLEIGHCMPGALLTPQGRVLFDMILYHRTDGFIIESDAPRIDDLFARLRRYRLRRPITLEIISDLQSWVIWHPAGNTSALALPPEIVLYDDPRNRIIGNADLGFRTLTTGVPEINGDVVALGDINDWHYRRIARGVPEGPIDLTPERALMLEAGLDQLGAVDFAKGCYIGQEVTARTHYRGLVKRRLVPIMINAAPPAPDSDITYAGAVIATTKTSSCNTSSCITSTGASIALCLIKLSDIHAILADPVGLFVEGASASLAIPDWMTPLPDPARTDKANR